MKRKNLVFSIIIITVLVIAIIPYFQKRIELKEKLVNACNDIPSNYKEVCTKNFINVVDSYDEKAFYTNSKLDEIEDFISRQLESGECYIPKGNQLAKEEIVENINEQLGKYSNFDCGKIFIYTNDNYGRNFNRDYGYADCSIYVYQITRL